MKHTLMGIYIVGVIVSGIVGIFFAFYALFGFMTWIFTDPLHWISPPPQERLIVSPDVTACREKGGFAILSGWTGGLKECQIPKL